MDKSTLSNYGWIVICVLVLSVMIALASPFGSYVASAVENTTQGLFDVQQGALSAAGIDIADQSFDGGNGGESSKDAPLILEAGAKVPEGCMYLSYDASAPVITIQLPNGATSQWNGYAYYGGDTFPLLNVRDVFFTNDYVYNYDGRTGWWVLVLDNTQTKYGKIYSSINGLSVTQMDSTFAYCTSLKTAPAIPSSVTNMSWTFNECTSLTTAPVIPSSVTNMDFIFANCPSLTEFTYQGTIAQFDKIVKYVVLDGANMIIHCSDGDITI